MLAVETLRRYFLIKTLGECQKALLTISSTGTLLSKAKENAIFLMSCPEAVLAVVFACKMACVNQYDTLPAFKEIFVEGLRKMASVPSAGFEVEM